MPWGKYSGILDSLGFSILRNSFATGYPEPQTATTWSSLSINLRAEERVTVASPHSSLNHNRRATSKIITTRDWYPQTVAYAARTLLNILESYPSHFQLQSNKTVLILHGGAVDSLNCAATNRNNDIPCNHGVGSNLPADFRHLQQALTRKSANDSFLFTVTSLNISGTSLPFTPTNTASILAYLQPFDVVIFFKHWSTNVTTNLQQALVQYVDNGGGLLGIHHALYNDSINTSFNKNIIRDQLFGVESSSNTWSGVSLLTYPLFQTDYGHFISTYGIQNHTSLPAAPTSWTGNPLPLSANVSFATYTNFQLFDELYNNMQWRSGVVFGRRINQTTPLFSNGQTPASINHTSGFTRLFNQNLDNNIGKVVYLQPGERRENYDSAQAFTQVIRNALAWLGVKYGSNPIPVTMFSIAPSCSNGKINLIWKTASETHNDYFVVQTSTNGETWNEVMRVPAAANPNKTNTYSISLNNDLESDYYKLVQADKDGTQTTLYLFANPCSNSPKYFQKLGLYPNPTTDRFTINSPEAVLKIEIKNSLGITVFTSKLSDENTTINTREWPVGSYFVEVNTIQTLYKAHIIKY
jgi:hypothetical protein